MKTIFISINHQMLGYKGFDQDMTCQGMTYQVGETYTLDGDLVMCYNGFHFCEELPFTFDYYPRRESRFCEVRALGKVIQEGDKYATDKLEIIRELTSDDIDRLSTGCFTRVNGSKEWYLNGELHRGGDQPAVVWSDGTKDWYQHGKLHRDGDQPAIIDMDGTKEWYQHGERHRDGDQPAAIYSDGRKVWYQHGKCHRDWGQPAVIWSNGTKLWYHYGKNYRM